MLTTKECHKKDNHSCKYHTPVYVYDVNVRKEEKDKAEVAYLQAVQVSKECSQMFAINPTVVNQELIESAHTVLAEKAVVFRFAQLQYDASDEGFAELHRLSVSDLKTNELDVIKTRLQLACWYMSEKEESEARLQEARKNIRNKFWLLPKQKNNELVKALEHELHTLQERISWKTTTDMKLRENFFASAAETMLSVKAIYQMLEKEMVSFADKHKLCVNRVAFRFN